jgi:type I restriction enzyme M protein
LEGLEAAEVRLSYTQKNNDIFRIDSIYFQKQYLKEEKILRVKGSRRLRESGAEVRSFGAYSLNNEVHYLDAGIPFIRGVNMKGGRVNFSNMLYISQDAHALLWKSEIKEGMVLLSMSGTIGEVAIATDSWPYPINSNQDIAKIDVRKAINPFILYAFLLSRFGQNYLKREARGSVQQHVFLSQIEQLEIPKLGTEFERKIQETIALSERHQLQSGELLHRAETTLLCAISLDNWQPLEALTYIRNSRDAFAAGRLDAEHFHPRFAALLDQINRIGGVLLGDWLIKIQRGKQPDYVDEGLPVVNSKHVLRGVVQLDANNRCAVAGDDDLLIQFGDVLVNGTGVGTIGRSATYLHHDKAVPDNHVTILRPKKGLDAVYLSVFMNSIVGQAQVEQRLRGSSGQVELYPNDIAQFRVSLPPVDVQKNIRQFVEQSYAQKQRATQLLAAAKRAVEIAIEDSEAAALAYLESRKHPTRDPADA